MGNVNYYILHYFESWGKDSSGEPMGRTHSEFIWATPKQMKKKAQELKEKGYSDINYEEADPITNRPLSLEGKK